MKKNQLCFHSNKQHSRLAIIKFKYGLLKVYVLYTDMAVHGIEWFC